MEVGVMRVVGVIQATAAVAAVATLLEAAVLSDSFTHASDTGTLFLQAAVLLLRVAVILQAVGAIHQEAETQCLEVAVMPCRQISQAAVGLEYLYRCAKRAMMSALHQTSPI